MLPHFFEAWNFIALKYPVAKPLSPESQLKNIFIPTHDNMQNLLHQTNRKNCSYFHPSSLNALLPMKVLKAPGVFAILILLLMAAIHTPGFSTEVPCSGPCNLRTQTQGGWGSDPDGGNNGAYLHNNFAAAFPEGVVIGDVSASDACTGYSLRLTTANAVTAFLPSESTPRALNANYTNPTGYGNVLAGQALALTLSIGFDRKFSDFGASAALLEDAVVTEGVFAGKTVAWVLEEANRALAGCGSAYSFSQINDVLSKINQNFVDGKTNNNYLVCPLRTPVLVIHNPAPVCAPGTVNLKAAAVTAGSTLPTGTVLSYWRNASATTALTNPAAVGAGTYYIKAASTAEGACADIEKVVVQVDNCIQEGCTIGYWKNHTDRWCGTYKTTDRYGDIFTSAPLQIRDLTLLQALYMDGGRIYNLGRQSVAALLNSCHNGVSYALTESEIIAGVNRAIRMGTPGDYAIYLDKLNNSGCPLGGTPSTSTAAHSGAETEAPVNSLEDKLAVRVYPNPVQDISTVSFSSPVETNAILQVFSMDGKQVSVLFEGAMEAGKVYETQLQLKQRTSGMYFYILQTEHGRTTGKILSPK